MTPLLAYIKPGEATQWTPAHHDHLLAHLYPPLQDTAFTLAVVLAAPVLDNPEISARVREFINLSAAVNLGSRIGVGELKKHREDVRRIKQAALDCQPEGILLRAAEAPRAGKETLLRPAAAGPDETSGRQLLRAVASTKDEGEGKA